jgi:hypothetical protein
MGTGSFLEVKRSGHGVDHPPPSSVEVKERVGLYLHSTSGPLWPVTGWTILFILVCDFLEDQNSVVGVATRYRLDGPGIKSWWGRNFPSHQDWHRGSPNLPIMGTGSFPGVKRPESGADHPLPSAGLRMGRRYISPVPFCLHWRVMGVISMSLIF